MRKRVLPHYMTLCILQIQLTQNTAARSIHLLRSALLKVNAGTSTVAAALCCFSQSLASTLGRQLSRHSQPRTLSLSLACLEAGIHSFSYTCAHTLAYLRREHGQTKEKS
jgi:hypothetical protein